MTDDAHEVPRSDWQQYFEKLTDEHEGNEVTIELLDQELGDEGEAQRLPLAYLDYDPKDDVFVVAVGGRDRRYPAVLHHLVEAPQRIVVDTYGPDDAVAVDVVGADEGHTIVTLHRPRL
jgi:uncharacterized protein DUF5335